MHLMSFNIIETKTYCLVLFSRTFAKWFCSSRALFRIIFESCVWNCGTSVPSQRILSSWYILILFFWIIFPLDVRATYLYWYYLSEKWFLYLLFIHTVQVLYFRHCVTIVGCIKNITCLAAEFGSFLQLLAKLAIW